MNYIALVNRTKQESGRSGGNLATVVGAAGDDLLICNWVAASWAKIQRLTHEWRWMRATVLASVVANQVTQDPATMLVQPANLLPITDLRIFYPQTEDYQLTLLDPASPAGEFSLSFVDFPLFRAMYVVGQQTAAAPRHWSISPQNKLLLGPKPGIAYHVRFDYRTAPSVLALDANIPGMPEEYHLAIVFGALMSLASFDNAPEVYVRAKDEYRELMSHLYADQGPTFSLGRYALA